MLEQRRQKVRLIQQRKVSDLTEADMKELPDQIPLPLVIGTEVTGWCFLFSLLHCNSLWQMILKEQSSQK